MGREGDYSWDKALTEGGRPVARFGTKRAKGRLHAGRDLYVEKNTEIVAIAPGVVLRCSAFYMGTNEVSIHHTASDGQQFIVRYGEVDPSSITVRVGQRVEQGQIIAKSGVLLDAGRPLNVVGHKNVSMLHFEAYSGALGFSVAPSLSQPGSHGFQRRGDLIDPLSILQQGYRATFLSSPAPQQTGDRKPIGQLCTSDQGKAFIREWEGVYFDVSRENVLYYDDSKGYCTVGWGHLIAKKSCEQLGYRHRVSTMPKRDALALFDADVLEHEHRLKAKITAPLYQYEFDALMSLVFNLGGLSKTPMLCEKVNNCNYRDAASEFLDIENKSRRRSEHNLFTTGTYDARH
ncbi:glycoside hydrolase family protein [Caballeronia sp. RCC_10]|uniref:glycoside hydrolase family protein n=1 Tax=Caballeronia sp. RCC_10 TaxID=3239227 RepID=UPI003525C8D8